MNYLWIFVGVVTIILEVLYIIFIMREEPSWGRRLTTIFIGAPVLGVLIGTILFAPISTYKLNRFGREQVILSEHNLVALHQDTQIEGDYSNFFFVGSGYIGETEYYCFYKQFSNGDIKFEKVRATEVFLNQSEQKPKVIRYGTKIKKEFNKSKWMTQQDKDEVIYQKTVLYIPKGTIKNNYKIN